MKKCWKILKKTLTSIIMSDILLIAIRKKRLVKILSNKFIKKKSKKVLTLSKLFGILLTVNRKEGWFIKKENVLWKLSKTSIWVAELKKLKRILISDKDIYFFGEFDPGSGWTLAACLRHASRTRRPLEDLVLARS